MHRSQHPHTPGQVTAAPTTYILAFHTVVVLDFPLQIVHLQGCFHAVVLLFPKDRKLLVDDGEAERLIPFALSALSPLLLPHSSKETMTQWQIWLRC